jgi:hypothetical protein
MGHTVGDGLISVALMGALVAYLYFKHRERQRRLEIIHQERLAAMDKGIPLPELPLDPTRTPNAPNPQATLIHGLAWTALGGGGMLSLLLVGARVNGQAVWPLPLPLLFLGLGLVLYYALASERTR